jgi:hypothetical protein
MNDHAVVLPPSSGIIAATAPQTRDALQPVCLPPENRRWETTSPSPFWPWFRPSVWVVTPFPLSVNPERLPNDGANVLLKSLRLS